jgi:hypothetical protein
MAAKEPSGVVSFVKSKADESSAPSWLKQVAMLTGALAALAGYMTVRGTYLANDAIYHSSQGILAQAKASDSWAEYQADSVKAHIAQTAMKTATDQLSQDYDSYRNQQPEVKQKAEDFEKQRDDEMARSTRRIGERDTLNYAGMAAQLAIALASVAALTRKYNAFIFSAFVGLAAFGITAYAMYLHFFVAK